MKTARLVIGILSIVLFVLITFQSCAAGFVNALEENGESSGSAGFLLAICMLVAGIVGIAARKSKPGSITAGCFYAVGGLIGIVNVGSFKDLMIWSILAFIFAALFIIGGAMQKKVVATEPQYANVPQNTVEQQIPVEPQASAEPQNPAE